ncbi:9143_t:CDS:1, partial [Funneliformis caledonium]
KEEISPELSKRTNRILEHQFIQELSSDYQKYAILYESEFTLDDLFRTDSLVKRLITYEVLLKSKI